MIPGDPFNPSHSMILWFYDWSFHPELALLLVPPRAALPADGMDVNWHSVGSLPLGVKKLQQSCPCVNTVCLLIPILFIIFALKEEASVHPPGDPLVAVKGILGWGFRFAGITQPLRPVLPLSFTALGVQWLQADLHCKSSSLKPSKTVFKRLPYVPLETGLSTSYVWS